jgi:hypothetical protein
MDEAKASSTHREGRTTSFASFSYDNNLELKAA